MTKVLTLRMDPALLEKAGSVFFASSDLAGMYEGGGKAATNQEARVRMRRRLEFGKPA